MLLPSHSARTRQGMQRSFQQGIHIGRPPKWSERNMDGSLRIQEDMVDFIINFLQYADSVTCKSDYEVLLKYHLPKVPYTVTVHDLRRIKRSTFYYGYLTMNGKYKERPYKELADQFWWNMRNWKNEHLTSKKRVRLFA